MFLVKIKSKQQTLTQLGDKKQKQKQNYSPLGKLKPSTALQLDFVSYSFEFQQCTQYQITVNFSRHDLNIIVAIC